MPSIRRFATTIALLLCACPFAAQADPRYTVTVIGNGIALGVNASGQVVGALDTGGGGSHAFLYSSGLLTDLGTFGGQNSTAWGINDHGQVVGAADNADELSRAFSYSGAGLTGLGTLGGDTSGAYAINNAGQIVGASTTAAGESRAFLAQGGTLQDLGTLPSSGGAFSYGYAINDAGTIGGYSTVGEYTPPETNAHAFVRGGGGMIDLGTLGGVYSAVFDINDLGEAVGVAATAQFHVDDAFLYSNGKMIDLGALPGGSYAEAFGINNHSQVVGSSNVGGGFLYENGRMIDLNTLIDPASGWYISEARDINDLQQIAGQACKGDVCYAVRLDLVSAVPEPDGYAMLGLGLALVGMSGARRRRQSAVRSANSSGNSTTSSILRR